jgi:uncharacterized membrane protein
LLRRHEASKKAAADHIVRPPAGVTPFLLAKLCEISILSELFQKGGESMVKLEKSVTIKAPVEKVFDYLGDPKNLPEIWPSMIEVRDIQPSPVGGYNFSWTYKMAGMRFEGASETTEYIANQRNVTESKKGIQSRFIWTYKPEAGGMKLTVQAQYTVPVPLLGKLAEAFIIKQNEHESDVLLANLKARMEA